MKIGIILGSVREVRAGADVAKLVAHTASQRDGNVDYELLDLRAHDVPLLTSPTQPMQAYPDYDGHPGVLAWSRAIAACDGFVFVTAEYNHGIPGAFKNAVDTLGHEWQGKVVGMIGYGSVGGVRAIEQWRQVLANFSMRVLRPEVNFRLSEEWRDGAFTPHEHRGEQVSNLLAAVEDALGANE